MTRLWAVYRAAVERQRQLRGITGARGLPRGKPLVRIRCGQCSKRIATVEEDTVGEIVTYSAARDRRFPGVVPRSLDCPEHGGLPVDGPALKAKLRMARQSGRAQTLVLYTA
ncbi:MULTISPECIES: hypothetical protein [unclassified Streptomyces]|uniref:hypothetical protein n=1 Tax=unclassified Streptomyces TaxID=2593676 RepID=UPI0023661630|nr:MULTISPECIES: hypothetical protein [unclassified Streptomyces]MDF3141782.1 hypothetical protein [Streptomyces sp. T21Q-yed]WDF36443.1 hypothetical protein PBV52_06480 [Streptomyces sp. T12]